MVTVTASMLVPGNARGRVLWLEEPLSFWGGVDPEDGRIIDGRHPQAGSSVSGAVLVLPHGRGSSSSPSVVAEMIRRGKAPAGIVLGETDPMLVLGSLVAAELYGVIVPVAIAADARLASARQAELTPDGRLKFD